MAQKESNIRSVSVSRLNIAQFQSFRFRHSTVLNNIKFADQLILRLQNCEMFSWIVGLQEAAMLPYTQSVTMLFPAQRWLRSWSRKWDIQMIKKFKFKNYLLFIYFVYIKFREKISNIGYFIREIQSNILWATNFTAVLLSINSNLSYVAWASKHFPLKLRILSYPDIAYPSASEIRLTGYNLIHVRLVTSVWPSWPNISQL